MNRPRLSEPDEFPARERSPRTLMVLLLLVAASALFSYLASYALSDALVSADVLPAWTPDADPRPRWMGMGFVGLMTAFLLLSVAARVLSGRQLRRIDAMADE